jgi:hypothetical protein
MITSAIFLTIERLSECSIKQGQGRPKMQSVNDKDYVGHVTFDRKTCELIDRWRRIQTVIPTRRAAAVMLVRKAVARDLGGAGDQPGGDV